MIKWVLLVVVLVSGGIMWLLVNHLENTPPDNAILERANVPGVVRVVHSYKDGVHRYTGEIKLPHSCYLVDKNIWTDLKLLDKVEIRLTTTDKMLDIAICSRFVTGYPFEVITEARESATMKLFVDGVERRTLIIESDWQSPQGTVINPDIKGPL